MILDIVSVVIVGLYCIWGYSKGFIRSLLGITSFIIALALTFTFHSPVENWVRGTSLDENITSAILSAGYEKADENFWSSLPLPSGITEAAKEQAGTTMAAGAEAISSLIISLICSLGLFLAVLLALKILIPLVDKIFHLPVLNLLNRLCGLILGSVNGAFVLFILFAAFPLFATTSLGQWCTKELSSSSFAAFFYHNNLLVNLFS